jgi:hypothetical protein
VDSGEVTVVGEVDGGVVNVTACCACCVSTVTPSWLLLAALVASPAYADVTVHCPGVFIRTLWLKRPNWSVLTSAWVIEPLGG